MKKSGRKNDYFCSNTVNLEAADPNHSADTCTEFDSSRTIDELLRWAANESTAEIDFESIRLRAVESSRKSKMQRIRRIRALTAAGAAILLILFVFALTIGKINDCTKDPQVSAGLTPNAGATPEPFSNPMNLPSGYDSFQNAGTVADEAIKNTNMFPQNLPSEMHKKVDNDSLRISAEGFDANGNRLYYDCEVVDVAPYQLSVGQVGSFSNGVDIVYYWQITSGTCLRVRFFGFKQADNGHDREDRCCRGRTCPMDTFRYRLGRFRTVRRRYAACCQCSLHRQFACRNRTGLCCSHRNSSDS